MALKKPQNCSKRPEFSKLYILEEPEPECPSVSPISSSSVSGPNFPIQTSTPVDGDTQQILDKASEFLTLLRVGW